MAASVEVEAVADNILLELLKNNGFIEILEKRVEEELLQKHNEKTGEEEEDYVEEPKHGQNIVSQPFKDLIVSVNNSIETFLKNEEFLFFVYECAHNRQLSSLYDVQVFLDRLENAIDASDVSTFRMRTSSCARRLLQLSRYFTVTLCSRDKPVNISHIHHFVVSFCEMLYRMENLLRSTKETEELSLGIRRCADNYNIMVFKKISLVYQQKLKENLKFMKKEENKKMTLTPKPVKRKPLIQVQGRSPGFLMSPQLLKDRQRIQRTRVTFAPEIEMRSALMVKQARNPEKIVEAAKQMEDKWKHFFDSKTQIKNSVKSESNQESSASMRFARELSADIVKEIRNEIGSDGAGLIYVNIEPIYRKRSKRAINNTRYNAGIENKSAKPNGTTQPTATLNRNSSADLMVVAASPRSDMLLAAPVSERQRSRSLCAVQMEKDTQTMSACPSPAPAPKKENGRKTSNGLVPSLNRMRIQQCYKMAKPVIGEAILKRAASSRAELRALFSRLNDEQFGVMARQMFDLIDDSVINIDKADEVLQHAKDFGMSYADLCPFGFRPDFFSHLADAAIAECVKLDGGVHKRCDTLLAWSQLIGALFSSVRDGYYQRVRYQRRSSLPQHTITKQLSMDITATFVTQE